MNAVKASSAINGLSLVLSLPGEAGPKEFDENTFSSASSPDVDTPVSVENFYIATHGDMVVNVVGDANLQKHVIGALVGGWIAKGFDVTKVSRKDLLKKLRSAAVKPEVVAQIEGKNQIQQGGGEQAQITGSEDLPQGEEQAQVEQSQEQGNPNVASASPIIGTASGAPSDASGTGSLL